MEFSGTFWPLAINRFLADLAGAIVTTNGSDLVLDALPAHKRAKLGSAHYAGIGAGISVAALMVAIVEGLAGSYPHMWLSCALLAPDALRAIPALHDESGSGPAARKSTAAPWVFFNRQLQPGRFQLYHQHHLPAGDCPATIARAGKCCLLYRVWR